MDYTVPTWGTAEPEPASAELDDYRRGTRSDVDDRAGATPQASHG